MDRYERMPYARCGRSGLRLSRVAFGLWHNFGTYDDFANMGRLVSRAFDLGVTHFDLANNYGPEPGSAEENFGRLLATELKGHRDELIVTTKAGHLMWPGPYGDWGSGKALYVGISKYSAAQTRAAAEILARNGTPLLIHQFRYNMFTRGIEGDGLLDALEEVGAGGICFSPLAQGLLTSRYLAGIPSDSRAAKNVFLKSSDITPERRAQLLRLDAFAKARGLTLSELALKWNLRDPRVTSVLIGASRVGQLEDNLGFLSKPDLSSADLEELEGLL